MGEGKVKPMLGSAEDALAKLGQEKVDTVFVYFGALNTTTDLDASARAIAGVLKPGGRAVLSVVNRWYLFDVLWNVVMLRPKAAMARLRPVWGGYSPTRHLPSVCYSARSVNKAFSPHLKRVRREGFCITHPAWYRHQWAPKGSLRNRLFLFADRVLKHTRCGTWASTASTSTNVQSRTERRRQDRRNGRRLPRHHHVHRPCGGWQRWRQRPVFRRPCAFGLRSTPRWLRRVPHPPVLQSPAGGTAPARRVNNAPGSLVRNRPHPRREGVHIHDGHPHASVTKTGYSRSAVEHREPRTGTKDPRGAHTCTRDRPGHATVPHRPRRLRHTRWGSRLLRRAPWPHHGRRTTVNRAPPTPARHGCEQPRAGLRWPPRFASQCGDGRDLCPPKGVQRERAASCRPARGPRQPGFKQIPRTTSCSTSTGLEWASTRRGRSAE